MNQAPPSITSATYETHLRARRRCRNYYEDFEPWAPAEIEQSIPDRFEKIAARYPARLAVDDGVRSYTYMELDRVSNQVANSLLRQRGPEPEPIAMMFNHGAEMVVAALGIMKAGKFYLPMNLRDPSKRHRQILEDGGAVLLLADHNNHNAAANLSSCVRTTVTLDDFTRDTSSVNPCVQVKPEAYAYILYTAGSTGSPKGVVGLHRNVLRYAQVLTNSIGFHVDDRISVMHSIAYSGSIAQLYPAILNGAAAMVFDLHKDGIARSIEWLIEEKITCIVSGSFIRAICPYIGENHSFPHARVLFLGGAPTYREHFEVYRERFNDDCILVSSLSSTEVSGIARIFLDKHAVLEREALPAGYPEEEMEVVLLDDDDVPVDDDEDGEIALRTQFMGPGYWHRPDLTDEVYIPDPLNPSQRLYKTGDVGKLLPDGCLIHMGRKDHQVKVRGYRVELSEVESHLLKLPGVRDAVVHGATNAYGQRLAAYIVSDDRSLTADRVRQSLAVALPDYAVPQSILFMDVLPRLVSGKVDRGSLPEPSETRPALSTTYVAPAKPLEAQLAIIWAEVLNVDRVGVNDRFTDLGGDSLSAARLVAALDELSGRRLLYASVVEAPTVRAQTHLLEEDDRVPQWKSLVTVQEGGELTPLFLVPPAASTCIGFITFAAELGIDQPVYGFDPLGLEGDSAPLERIEEMAAHYIDEMKQIQPQGPYCIGGQCFGALPALEMAHQLESAGEAVGFVAILDSGAVRAQESLRLRQHSLARWRMQRLVHSPISVLRKSLVYRMRRVDDRVSGRGGNAEMRQRAYAVQRASKRAWARYSAQPIGSRMLLFMSQQYSREGRNDEWRKLAAGEFEEHLSQRWSHRGFLSDPDNLAFVCAVLRDALTCSVKASPTERL